MYAGLIDISGVTCVRPDGAFYLFPSIRSTGLDSMTFSQRFLEEELVAVVPGRSFGADDYIRFSYATDMATIEKGIERLRRFIGRL
jgi:aspartate aminotransferase